MAKQEKEDASVYALIAAMASNTGMHGLPNVGRSQHTMRKIFWMLTFLVGAGKCSTSAIRHHGSLNVAFRIMRFDIHIIADKIKAGSR